MRIATITMAIGAALLASQDIRGDTAGGGNAMAERSHWYLGASAGPGRGATLDQEGWNLDTFCYPDNACFDQDPIPSVAGYRWNYDIDLDGGAAFELSAGRMFGRARLELTLAQQTNDASQNFTGISFHDGSPSPPRAGSTVDSNSRASIDRLAARSILLNGYYDFPGAWGGFSPYVGIGAGLADVEFANVHYSSDYRDPAGGNYDPPLSFYNSVQNADLGDRVFAWALHAGADYRASGPLVLGLKLTWSGTGDFETVGGYETHAMHAQDPDFANTNSFGGTRNWALRLTVKRLLGE